MKYLLKKLMITTMPITTVVATSVAAMSCGGKVVTEENDTLFVRSDRETVLRNILAPVKGQYLNNVVNTHLFETNDVKTIKSKSKLVEKILFDQSNPLVYKNKNLNNKLCFSNFKKLKNAIHTDKSYYLNITNKLDIELFENNSNKPELETAMANFEKLISQTNFPHEDLNVNPKGTDVYFTKETKTNSNSNSNFLDNNIRPGNNPNAFYPLAGNDFVLGEHVNLEYVFGRMYHFIKTGMNIPSMSVHRANEADIQKEFKDKGLDFSIWYANGESKSSSTHDVATLPFNVLETKEGIITMKIRPSIQFDESKNEWYINLRVNLYLYNTGEESLFSDDAANVSIYSKNVVKFKSLPTTSDFTSWNNAISKDFRLDILATEQSILDSQSVSDSDQKAFKTSMPNFGQLIKNLTKNDVLKSFIETSAELEDHTLFTFMNSGIQGTIDISKEQKTLIDQNTTWSKNEKATQKETQRQVLIDELITNLEKDEFQQKVLDASMANKVDIKSFANMINSLTKKPYDPNFNFLGVNNVALSMLYQVIEVLRSIRQIK